MNYPQRIQAIADVLRPELVVQHSGRGLVLGDAADPNAVTLSSPKGKTSALVVSFDQAYGKLAPKGDLADWLYPLFADAPNLRKSCDFLIFHEENQMLWVFLCELKAGHAGYAGQQIAITKHLADYLLNVVFHPTEQSNIAYRRVVFKDKCHPAKLVNGLVTYSKQAGLLATTLPRGHHNLAGFCR